MQFKIFVAVPTVLFMFALISKHIHVLEKQSFIVRAHIYQARSLIGSDDSGLSGKQPFVFFPSHYLRFSLFLLFSLTKLIFDHSALN